MAPEADAQRACRAGAATRAPTSTNSQRPSTILGPPTCRFNQGAAALSAPDFIYRTLMAPRTSKAGAAKQKPKGDEREETLQAVVSGRPCSARRMLLDSCVLYRSSPIRMSADLRPSRLRGREYVLRVGASSIHPFPKLMLTHGGSVSFLSQTPR